MTIINQVNSHILDSLQTSRVVAVPYKENTQSHYIKDKLSVVYINDLRGGEYVIGINHTDLPRNSPTILAKLSKYEVVALDSRFINKYIKCIDYEQLYWYFTNQEIPEDFLQPAVSTLYRRILGDIPQLVNFIPVLKLTQHAQTIVSYYNMQLGKYQIDYGVKYYNDVILHNLLKIESSGLAVSVGKQKQYGYYRIHSTTGRPSNHFDSVNYMSLNKTDGTRSKYVSSFTKGRLVEFDFRAFHPTLIAKLIGYDFKGQNPYEVLAQQYYDTAQPTPDQITSAKTFTFQQLYGGVDMRYRHIAFFEQMNHLTKNLWELGREQGYVETPIAKRKMYLNFYEDLNPPKLFNYYIQAFETEYMGGVLTKVHNSLTGFNSKVVLYVYDSFLLDFDQICDSFQLLNDIYKQLNALGLHYTIKVGTDYNNLTQLVESRVGMTVK